MPVFIEVVAPDRSDLDKAAQDNVRRAPKILSAAEGQFLEVQLLTFPTDTVIAAVRRSSTAHLRESGLKLLESRAGGVTRVRREGAEASSRGRQTNIERSAS